MLTQDRLSILCSLKHSLLPMLSTATRSLTWQMYFDCGTPCSARPSEARRAHTGQVTVVIPSFGEVEAIWPDHTHFCVAGPKRPKYKSFR